MPKAKAAKKDQYEYTDINSIKKEGDDDQYHFYGTVIDSSFPYKTDKRYVVTCKVADASCATKGGKLNAVNLVFFAKSFEDLPIIQRVGDIVRVHRAQLRHHNDERQLVANMYYRSSWCLFIGNDSEAPLEPKVENEDGTNNYFSYTPYNFSGKSFTQEAHEAKILKDLKKWSKEYFAKNDVVNTNIKKADVEAAVKNQKDFDLLVRVTELKDHDQYSNAVTFNDSTGQTWSGNLLKRKFPHLKNGDVARIRSVSAKEDNTLLFSGHSNILKFFSFSKVEKSLKASISAETHIKTCVTELTKPANKKIEFTALKKLFFNPNKNQKLFRCQFCVLKVDKKGATDKNWTVKLIVTDYTNQQDDKAYMVHLDDKTFFKGVTAANWDSAASKKKVEKGFKALTNKQNYVDAVLEREKKNYFIRHTQMN